MEEINSQMKKLYVCDIAPTVNPNTLQEKFSSFGKLESADVRLDRKTKTPRFAFITYENHSDAEKAFKELNYAEFEGMQIRIMWSKNDMDQAPVGESNVLVKGLKGDVTSKSLHEALDKFGTVFSCKVPLLNGKSKGYGYVNFTTEEEAEKALMQNGMEFVDSEGKYLTETGKLDISPFTSHAERVKKSKENKTASFTNVYIKNFGDNLDDEKLTALFAKFGLISSACVMRNSNGTSKGFGFVDFVSHEDAVAAIDNLNGTCLPGTETVLYVGRAQKKTERREELDTKFSSRVSLSPPKVESKTTLYIKHLHEDVDDEMLRQTFAHFGKLISARVEVDAAGRSKGVGFVSFIKPNDAALALRSMRTRSILNKKIYIGYLQSRADRDVYLSGSKYPTETIPFSTFKQNRLFSENRNEHSGMPTEVLYRRPVYQQPQYPLHISPLSYQQQPLSHTVNASTSYLPPTSMPSLHQHQQQQQQQMNQMMTNGLFGVPASSHFLMR